MPTSTMTMNSRLTGFDPTCSAPDETVRWGWHSDGTARFILSGLRVIFRGGPKDGEHGLFDNRDVMEFTAGIHQHPYRLWLNRYRRTIEIDPTTGRTVFRWAAGSGACPIELLYDESLPRLLIRRALIHLGLLKPKIVVNVGG